MRRCNATFGGGDGGNAVGWVPSGGLFYVHELNNDLKLGLSAGSYLGLGIDLERFNGNPAWELPLPGRIVVDRDGSVIDADLHPNHTSRPEPEETLEILRRLA